MSTKKTNKIAKKSDWGTKPMPDKNTTFKLERTFSEAHMECLKRGNVPQAMEDKWFRYYEDGKLYIHRSWTGICVFIIEFNNETGVHCVTVNRNPEEYSVTDVDDDLSYLNGLLDWWAQPQYDYYHEWLSETVNTLKRQGLIDESSETDDK